MCRPSYTQPPMRKLQKLEGTDKPKKSKLTKQFAADPKAVGDESMKGKGDGPDRFWSTVEPYFADITESDIHILQETIDGVSMDRVGLGQGPLFLSGWSLGSVLDECNSLSHGSDSFIVYPMF